MSVLIGASALIRVSAITLVAPPVGKPRRVTSPTRMPLNSTWEPTDSPVTASGKTISTVRCRPWSAVEYSQ